MSAKIVARVRVGRIVTGFTALVACLGTVAAPSAARADSRTEIGTFAAVVAGSHVGSENPQPVGGVVPGAALEIVRHVGRVALQLEGIPTVAASTGTTGPFGRTAASLALLNSMLFVELGAQRRYRIGTGAQVVDLANFNGRNGDRNTVRITSPIYAVGGTLPLARGALDLDANVDPNLRGILHIFSYDGTERQNKPEAGAEIDYRAAYRWQRGNVVYRAGVRGLSYHTRDTRTGELVDRNVGAGVTFDVRFVFGGR